MLATGKLPQVSLDLLAAADVMITRGMCKGYLEACDGSKRVCLLGAIGIACAGTPFAYDHLFTAVKVTDPRANAAALAMQNALGMSVATWNNADERTQQEVVDKLREVAYSLALEVENACAA